MAQFIKTQHTFSHGEVAPEFYACDNIRGLSRLENMDVLSGGGLTRRMGLRTVAKLTGPARLITFSVTNDAEYILVMTNNHMHIYCNGTCVQDLITPWSFTDVSLLQYAQRFSTMIFAHPDYPPQTLYKQGNLFYLSPFSFARNDTDLTVSMPCVRFDDSTDIKITVTAHPSGNNYATLSASRDFWTPQNVGSRLYLLSRQWTVLEYIH